MKKLVFLALIFFAASGMAIGIQTDKSVYTKEDVIKISGSCETQVTISTIAEQGQTAFLETVQCIEGTFTYDYQTSFLDPTGGWTISASSEDQKASKEIFVKEKREAGFLLVNFLSFSKVCICQAHGGNSFSGRDFVKQRQHSTFFDGIFFEFSFCLGFDGMDEDNVHFTYNR